MFFDRLVIFVLLVLSVFATGRAQAETLPDRRALIVGNSDYGNLESLANPVNDARAVAEVLTELGFDVTTILNASRKEMLRGVRRFSTTLDENTVSLFYYAGHGIQLKGQNYLIPVDAALTENWQLQEAAVKLNSVVEAFADSASPLRIFMLDACRDNPLRDHSAAGRSLKSAQGLAVTDASYGTIISYATEPDRVALDGEGTNSPYTEALVKNLVVPGRTISEMLNAVGNEVLQQTSFRQTPWQSSSPIPEFCFAGCESRPVVDIPQSSPLTDAGSSAEPASQTSWVRQHRTWLGIGAGVLLIGALLSGGSSSGGSGDDGEGRPVTVQIPLP